MISKVDIHSSIAVYVQIENHIKFAIASGRLSPGDKLPSVHELSERLEVNINTIIKSYRDLEVMGYLYSRRGMGVFVNKDVETKCIKDVRDKLIPKMHEVISEAQTAGMTSEEVKKIVSKSMQIKSSPYEPTPPELLKLAKNRG